MVHVARQAGNAGPGGGGGEEARRGPTQGIEITEHEDALVAALSDLSINDPPPMCHRLGYRTAGTKAVLRTTYFEGDFPSQRSNNNDTSVPPTSLPSTANAACKTETRLLHPSSKAWISLESAPAVVAAAAAPPIDLDCHQDTRHLSIPSNRFIPNTEKTSLSQELRWPKD